MRTDEGIETLGRRVLERRTWLGLSLPQLAARSGMSPAYLEYVESQHGRPSAGVVRRLAEALHTTVEHLYGQPVLEPGSAFSPEISVEAPPVVLRPVVSALSELECLLLLGSVPVGRVAFVTHGPPVVLPVNFTLMGRDIVIRTRPTSALAVTARSGRLVTFEADDIDEPSRLGWSVLCSGPARVSSEREAEDHHGRELVRPWVGDDRSTVVIITAGSLTGRRIGIA